MYRVMAFVAKEENGGMSQQEQQSELEKCFTQDATLEHPLSTLYCSYVASTLDCRWNHSLLPLFTLFGPQFHGESICPIPASPTKSTTTKEKCATTPSNQC